MRQQFLFCIIFLLIIVFGQAAPIPSPSPTQADPLAAQQNALAQEVARQMEANRKFLNERDAAIVAQINAEKKDIENRVDAMMMKLKFELPISMAACIFAAMELHDILRKRRERKYLLMRKTLPPNDPARAQSTKDRSEAHEEENLSKPKEVAAVKPWLSFGKRK